MDSLYTEWNHSPSHLFESKQAYFITSGTYEKKLFFDTDEKRAHLMSALFEEFDAWNWRLEAWALMANHYHVIAHAPEDAKTLKRMLRALHSKTAIWLNKQDGTPGRKVWFQFRDTCLTFRKSYLARLNYVHHNPVKHGLVDNAENYPFCSMGWFTQHADPGFQRTVFSFKYDQITVEDDF